MKTAAKRECIQCGRIVARKFRIGLTRVVARHKCPHGNDCVGSNELIQAHSNHVSPKACGECYAERKHL